MPQNRVIIFMPTVPDSVVSLNSQFNSGIFNKDRTKRQIDGYIVDENEEYILPKRLCHDENYLLYLCRGEVDPAATVQTILDSSYEMKSSEYRAMRSDPMSEWYVEPEVLI
tara:strand:- start:1943 stop:2275 length:333 start_codon:yes stop_codon:yes gene_type:complete